MKRPVTEISFDLREWQTRAFKACIAKHEQGAKDFLCVATPGGGKTTFALRVGHHFLFHNLADFLVIVVPTEHLKKQWALAATKFGLDLDPEFTNKQRVPAPDYHGIVITYAQLGQDPSVHRALTESKKTAVVFDEVHHAGDAKTWGESLLQAFQVAVFRLGTSGTPFRSDDCEIPFVTYIAGVSRSDFEYTYAQAILDNVCRTVYFPAYDGKMKYKVGEEFFEHTFEERIDPDLEPKRLRTALCTDGNWLRMVIQEADKKLCEIRMGEHRDAGGLIFAIDQKHAKEIVGLVEHLTGRRPEIVTSEDANGSGKIENFKNGFDKWIVCVKMISEGVDIPRLRVGVYATNIKAELFFRQAVGRFVRVLKNLSAQDAFFYIAKDRDMVKMATEIEQERDHALEEAKKNAEEGEAQESLFPEYTPARTGKFVPLGSVATGSEVLSVNVGISSGMKVSKMKKVIPPEELSVFQKKERLKAEICRLAKLAAVKEKLATKQDVPFHIFHKRWIEQGGKPIEQETIEELEARDKWLRSQLNNYNYRGY